MDAFESGSASIDDFDRTISSSATAQQLTTMFSSAASHTANDAIQSMFRLTHGRTSDPQQEQMLQQLASQLQPEQLRESSMEATAAQLPAMLHSQSSHQAFLRQLQGTLGKPSTQIVGLDGNLQSTRPLMSNINNHRIHTNRLSSTQGGQASLSRDQRRRQGNLHLDRDFLRIAQNTTATPHATASMSAVTASTSAVLPPASNTMGASSHLSPHELFAQGRPAESPVSNMYRRVQNRSFTQSNVLQTVFDVEQGTEEQRTEVSQSDAARFRLMSDPANTGLARDVIEHSLTAADGRGRELSSQDACSAIDGIFELSSGDKRSAHGSPRRRRRSRSTGDM